MSTDGKYKMGAIMALVGAALAFITPLVINTKEVIALVGITGVCVFIVGVVIAHRNA